ncbi:DNA methyltransferase [Arthrobacter sp. S2(2024)]|uniref:DNA methyltransferase n=1 Tax=Arthrobacter sp. S2(2024) TaxID=3111911 RepID=UPI002FC75F48
MSTDVPEAVFEEVASFPLAADIHDHALLSLSLRNKTNGFTHGLHRFPAKFIPQVAEWAIRSYADGSSKILDPFSGSGTTLVEAVRAGLDAVGQEINPLARLISRVKSTPLDPRRLEILARDIAAKIRPINSELMTPIAGVENFDHWFTRPAWRDLQTLKSAILTTPMGGNQREFFLVVFSSILRWVSNADDQTQKTYVSGTRTKIPPAVMATWEKSVQKAIAGMDELVPSGIQVGDVEVPENGNALQITCDDGSINLAITSPPYLDSVDYPYNLMLEHFWLAPELNIESRKAFNDLRRQQMGAKSPASPGDLPFALRDRMSVLDFPESRRLAAASYFAFMDAHLGEMSRVLTPDGRYVMVVGNSRTGTGTVPIHESIIELAEAHGLYLEHSFGYRVRRHYMKFPRAGRGGIILIDWVLTFAKSPRRLASNSFILPSLTLDPHEVAH